MNEFDIEFLSGHKYYPPEKDKAIIEHDIICPHCGQKSGYTQEGIMFLYIAYDLVCQHCHKVIIYANNGVEWKV